MLSGGFMCEPRLLFYGLWKKKFCENFGSILDFSGIPSKSGFQSGYLLIEVILILFLQIKMVYKIISGYM